MTTKLKFLLVYRKNIVASGHPWTKSEMRVDAFMAKVAETLAADGSNGTPWAWDGPWSKTTWKEIGMKGPLTLKALRALPYD